ncbi:hypothetical protein I79_002471 [Cricetulus griseus]|uniref:Uncharacterized protein n=1 Tax=Cricetulus griseus TaxID=10029 RepID=G3GXI1_CRIGR|nr:hypothetical protein I79_002471 [Cricetulus griseus]
MKRHYDHSHSFKGKHLIGVAHLEFRGSVHYHHGETWWCAADVELKRYLLHVYV